MTEAKGRSIDRLLERLELARLVGGGVRLDEAATEALKEAFELYRNYPDLLKSLEEAKAALELPIVFQIEEQEHLVSLSIFKTKIVTVGARSPQGIALLRFHAAQSAALSHKGRQ